MKTIRVLILTVVFLFPALVFSQIDCSKFLENRVAEEPYRINSVSKSAACVTGNTYELTVPLQAGYEYRLIFYASSVFNNKVNFKIVDLNTGETVLDLPGETGEGKPHTAALEPYWDNKLNREVHPYFDFIPQTTTNFKIIIDVEKQDEVKKGCVSVLVLDKPSDVGGF